MKLILRQWFTWQDALLVFGIGWFAFIGVGWYRASHGLPAGSESANNVARAAEWVYARSQKDLANFNANLLYAKEHPAIDWGLVGVFSLGLLAMLWLLKRTFSNYLRVTRMFGRPSLKSALLLLRLDTWRLRPFNEGSIHALLGIFAGFVLIAGPIYYWYETGLNCLVLLPPIGLVFLAWRPLKAVYPPCVLVLANSGPRAQHLQRSLTSVSYPLRIVSLLRSYEDQSDRKSHEADSFRTRDSKNWRELVHCLMRMVPIVILDIRRPTSELEYELDMLHADGVLRKTLVLKEGSEPFYWTYPQASMLERVEPLIESSQLFTEQNLYEYFHECVHGDKRFRHECRNG